MNSITKSILAAALTAAVFTSIAQDAPPAGEGRPPRGPGGPGGRSPIVAALDTNNDGVIDAAEINGASKALLTLDKNGDGKLTADEIRPARGEGRGPGGPGRGDGEGKRPERKPEAQ